MKDKEIIKFLKDNCDIFESFLVNLDGFPYVCDISSMILIAYISTHIDDDLDYYITENYNDNEDLIHCWIEFSNYIIDFTWIQFSTNLNKLNKIKYFS